MNENVKFFSALKRIFKYSKGFKLGFIIVIILSIASALSNLVTPYLLGLATTSLFDSFTKKVPIDYNYIYLLLLILAILYILNAAFNYSKAYISAKIAQNLCYSLRKDLIHKMNVLDIKELEKRKKGDLISIIINDVEKINDFFTESIPSLIYHGILMIGIIFMMLYINVKLAILTFITIPLIFMFLAFIVKKTQKYFDLNQSTLGSVNAFVEESITNDIVIKSFNKEEYFNKEFELENKKLYEYNFKSIMYSGIANPLIKFITNLNYVVIVSLGAYFCIKGSMKVGEIQTFVKYMQEFSRPLGMLGEIIGSVEFTVSAINRIFVIIDDDVITDGYIEKIENPNLISFKDVCFSYNKDKKILKNINIDINKGEQVAIVGKTGSGKTTIINLLMGFYEVNSGKILIDGVNINDIKKKPLRNKISMVLQDTWIWNASLKENITFDNNYTKEEIDKVIEEANLTHIINSFPNGINFIVNEESNNISEGEKQLVTIARALITNPEVLILDEATSNVDSRLEYLIHNSMKKLMKNRTSIVIAHRLSTIVESDKIVVIDDGEVKEVGTHKELLKKKGYYYNLYYSGFDK